MDRPLVLFYSKFCAFSSDVRQKVASGPLKTKLVQICVDDKPRHLLPAAVKRVPTLIDRQTGDVFVGESISKVIASINGSVGSSREMPSMPGHMQQQRNMPNDMPTAPSAGFNEIHGPVALNEDSGPYALMAGQSLNILDESYAPLSSVIETCGNSFASKTGKSDGIESKFEQMMAERQQEAKGHKRM